MSNAKHPTSQRPVRTGVIGVGALGTHHARLYAESPEAELVGVYDANPDQAGKIAEDHHCRVYPSPSSLSADVEAVSVAVPTNLHFDTVRPLLEAGVHVLVEKPLASHLDEGRQLIELAEQNNRILAVGHVERYNPILKCLHSVAGPPRFISAERLASYPPPRHPLPPRGTEASVVHDLMIHDLDVILSLVDSPVTQIDATGIAILSPTEDIVNARLCFADGCVATLNASRLSKDRLRKIRIFKDTAYLSLDYQEQKGEIATVRDGKVAFEPVPVHEGNALLHELEDFCRCVQSARQSETITEPKVSGRAGLAALGLADQIVAACRLNPAGSTETILTPSPARI